MNPAETLEALKSAADPTRKPGMARVGINVERALGVSVPNIRRIAKKAGTDHELALELWSTGIHEARMVAALVADPDRLTWKQLQAWSRDLDSWDVVDMAADTFATSKHRDRAIRTWAAGRHGFAKRCAFSMIARLAVSERDADDALFVTWFPTIRAGATDERNEVKKAVSWSLRQIGKRNRSLNAAAIREAEEILAIDSPPARWIARDVLRELRDPVTRSRLRG